MKLRHLIATAALLSASVVPAFASPPGGTILGKDASSNTIGLGAITCGTASCAAHAAIDTGGNVVNPATSDLQTAMNSKLDLLTNSGAITNPSSTLTLTSATTAYAAGQAITNSATAGSITVPSFSIPNAAGGFIQARGRLYINDPTATGWGGVIVQIDEWSAAPTYSTGDRTTVSYATGSAAHLASFSCTMSSVYGDGVYAECAPTVGTAPSIKLPSGTSVYWTAQAVGATGVTGASKVMTWVPELAN